MPLRDPDATDQNIRCARLLSRLLGAFLILCVRHLGAQTIGSIAADRARLAEITGDTTQSRVGSDPRLVDVLAPVSRFGLSRVPLVLVRPEVRTTWNSALPYTLNDGPLWAGRGWNVSVNAGVALEQPYRSSVIRLVVAPTIVYSENLPFQIFPSTVPGRSQYANPFHGPDSPIDLPLRFGDRYLVRLDPGRSSVSVRTSRVVAGYTTENDWWGPAIRNPLLMSNNAPGVPRWFVRTGKPVRTRTGSFDARLISGTLTQSLFFDPNESKNRTLSGVLVQLRPAFDSTLTFGFARVVYAPIGPYASPFTMTLAHSFDAIARWENLAPAERSDQIYSVMARWIFPASGFDVYTEWAHIDLPHSVTELLVAGHHTAGYTLGFQWAQPRHKHDYLRLQSEITYLEQSLVFPDRPPPDYYTGRGSPQGYTQRGQVIGASIGPGASSQFIAVDYLAQRWQLGGFLGRIRWDNDALYRQVAATFFRHDVSILSGLRGGWRTPVSDFSAELTVARRYNYLFQNGFAEPGGYRTVDVQNVTLALVATPR